MSVRALEVDEPLAESAPLAWAAAPAMCHRDPDTGESCAWYHRVWQYLRLLGLMTSVRTNTDFLLERFRECARSGGFERVLVSATADYAVLAHLAAAYRCERAPLDVTVVDVCDTALMLNRWYAERYGVSLATVRSDVLAFDRRPPFDVVCTHNFFTRFDAAGRERLAARWYALLRPGGRVVMVQRVRPGQSAEKDRFTPEQARELAREAERRARAYAGGLGVDASAFGEAVHAYALRKGAYVVGADEEILGPLERAGLRIDRADHGGADERASDIPSSPVGPDSYRMRVVATRVG